MLRESRFPFGPEEDGRRRDSKAGGRKRRKKVTMRLDKASVECIAELPLPPPFQTFPPCLDLRFVEVQESWAARLRAEREEHDRILRQ